MDSHNIQLNQLFIENGRHRARSVAVLHAAVFADCQSFAILGQLFMANLLGFSVFKTFCGIQMRLGHRAMIGNVFFGFGCAMGFTLFSRTGRQ
ncbi:MAG: hypothetical protein ACO3EU_08380, partial [Arenimonas sp.]